MSRWYKSPILSKVSPTAGKVEGKLAGLLLGLLC